ncbi:MAG: hypothetical protein Q8Q26_01640 [Pseudorhodobacter sp.]|nr:hypothetical protein [Pseudorhodobacter sp.]
MTAKTTEPAPTTEPLAPEPPVLGGGCCGGKAHGRPAQESRDTASGAKTDAKPGGCGCGNG